MLLVDDDESEARKGQEDGRAGAEYYVVRLGGELLLPYLHTLSVAVS